MATSFPTSLDAAGGTLRTDISSSDDLDASGKEHDVMHVNVHGAAIALETKVGTGASTPVADAVFMGTGTGTSGWDTSPTFKGAVTVGVDGTGHDVKFFGATATNGYMLWDESEDDLIFGSSSNIFMGQTSTYTFTGSSDGNTFINAADTKATYHRINNSTEMIVNGNGVSIGRGDSGPSYRLDIHEETNDAVPLRVEMSSGGTANQYLARFTRNTGLLTNGIYCDTTNAYFGTPSDERIKRDIATIDPADSLAAITALRPVDYRYIADPDDGEIRNGLIAQEVEPVIPAAVHTVIETEPRMETVSVPRVETVVDDDGNETTVPVLDEDGNQIIDEYTQRIIDTTGDSKMLSWDAVNAHMVGAIKNIDARIAALEAA